MNSDTLVPNTPTTIGSWALLIAKVIESYQLDSAVLFKEADIDLVAIQQNPELRLPVSKMSALWQLAMEHCQDPAFALRLNQFFQPSTYSTVGLAIASSRNVLEGLERCLRYFKLTTDAANYYLDKGAEHVTLSIEILPATLLRLRRLKLLVQPLFHCLE